MSQGEIQMPRDYGSWKTMIVSQCKEELSKEFIEQRLKTLKNPSDPHTQKFKELYGESYLKTVISWFERAANDIV